MKKSIQGKILQVTTLPFLAIIAIVFLVFFSVVNGLLYESFRSELLLKSEANLSHINSTISQYSQTMSGFVFDLEKTTDRSEATYIAAIDQKLSVFPAEDISALYVGYGDRNFLYEALGWVPSADYDITTRPWYSIPITTPGQSIMTYADANTGIYALCISEQIGTDTGEPAVLALDITITSTFESAKMSGDREYFFIQDSDGMIIYHPNKEFMPHDNKMVKLAEATPEYAKLSDMHSGDIVNIRDYDGNEYSFTSIDLPKCGFKIFTGMQTSIVSDEVQRILVIGILLVAGLLILLSIMLLLFVRRSISMPLRFATKYLGDIAATGNLDIAEQRKSECLRYMNGVTKSAICSPQLGICSR